jgi:aryl-alcohol dehydrogenase-like predicted oxidoreductase
LEYVKDAVKALDVKLTADEYKYLEEPYVAHGVVGAV